MSNTASQILDGVLVVVAQSGLAGLSVESVADVAGVSRQTVYRHFGSRHQLIERAILREEEVFLEGMLQAARGRSTLRAAVEAATVAALERAREHALLARLLEREPESLLPYLLLGRGPVVSAAEPAVESLLLRYRPDIPPERLQLVADIATRLLVSYVVSPLPGTEDSALAREVASAVEHLVDTQDRQS